MHTISCILSINSIFFLFQHARKAPKKKEPSTADGEGAFNNVALQRNSTMLPEKEVNSDTIGISDLSITNICSYDNSKESTDGIHEFIFGRSTWIITTMAVSTTDIQNYFEKQVEKKVCLKTQS